MPIPQTDMTPLQAARKRGEILRQLGLMEEVDEQEFDELVELAAALCGKALSAMTLLDEETQLIKARMGFQGARTMPVRESICQYTVQNNQLLVVEDTVNDERFRGPVGGSIRFYAGTPLTTLDGTAVGALCVMDTAPSVLSEQQLRALQILGRQLSNRIQLRERARSMADMMSERERAREMFVTILNNVPAEIYLKDEDGRLRFYNRKLANRFAINEAAWLGKTSRDLWDEETALRILQEDREVFLSGEPQETFLDLKEADGKHSYWRTTKAPCQDSNGNPVLACCSVDLTEQRDRERQLQETKEELEEANRKLSSLALTDALTGLWNRRAFDSRLETAVIAAQRSKKPLALMLLDVDHFKRINDRFGHPCGDEVLRNVATILNRTKRADEVACRFGGEEFTILMPGTDAQGAMVLGERIRKAMHAFEWDKEPITISMGIAVWTDGWSSDDLVDNADAALYRAKEGGRDRFICYNCDQFLGAAQGS
ncbi:diguanylate cyclase [Terriglobus roseus]|uniref:diguanylate cyclase n=1 Tax=Terriglobus roseus TaxID=392734 RepID=A0A1G7P6W8_9BACT|nr:diguanylate cyclase [Terriglobus roseus]SDF82018.1 PAS domain S-box-containing protein/diguanylate cyclase (GGDEF) domain-containing protein [Terriglobus roseus]